MLDDTTLTTEGKDTAKFPTSPIGYNAIAETGQLGCRGEMLSMAAIASSQEELFLKPKSRKD